MKRAGLLGVVAALMITVGAAQAQKRGLDITFVDTEGGAATLIVTPSGESVHSDMNSGSLGTPCKSGCPSAFRGA